MATRSCLLTAALAAVVLSGGCLQVEMQIQMHEDGGATITERVRFLQSLMELDAGLPADRQLQRMLERPAVEARMKEMGKGVTLVSHKVSDLPNGSREGLTEFKIPDVEDLRLVNPHLAQGDPNRLMRLQFTPIYRVVHSYHELGELMLTLVPAEQPRPRPPSSQPDEPANPSPLDVQLLRDLRPMFADMMDGFEVKLRLNANRPITYGWVRDRQSASKTINLISFTDEDLDAFGSKWVENEELMLSMMRLNFDAENIADQVQGFAGNQTLPVFRCRKPYGSGLYRVPPNDHQFKKYFAGRPKSQGGDQPG